MWDPPKSCATTMYRLLLITAGLQNTAERAAGTQEKESISTGFCKRHFNICCISKLSPPTGDVLKAPEGQLHVVPHIHAAEPQIGLSEGYELVSVELVGLH